MPSESTSLEKKRITLNEASESFTTESDVLSVISFSQPPNKRQRSSGRDVRDAEEEIAKLSDPVDVSEMDPQRIPT